MSSRWKLLRSLTVSAAFLVAVGDSQAVAQQNTPSAYWAALAKFGQQFRSETRPILSSGVQHLFDTALSMTSPGVLVDPGNDGGGDGGPIMGAAVNPSHSGPIQHSDSLRNGAAPKGLVSSRALDFSVSRFAGSVQNESAAAWCGPNVVVGYNDFAAEQYRFHEIGTTGIDMPGLGSGVAYSSDGGSSFTALPYLPPGNVALGGVFGVAALACSDQHNFYYASYYQAPGQNGFSAGIGLNVSHDGGHTWSDPTIPVNYTSGVEFADNPSIVVDPGNPRRLYLSFLYFNGFGGPECNWRPEFSIGIVKSEDAGSNWTAPQLFGTVCYGLDNSEAIAAPQVAASADGKVYVAWLHYAADRFEQIRFVRSFDHGNTFTDASVASKVVPAGTAGFMQGILVSNERPSIAVDNSSGPRAGTVYIGWTDGRYRKIPDAASPTGTYNFGDAAYIESKDFGASWSSVNTVIGKHAKSPTAPVLGDQYMTTISVDYKGTLGLCYYDRTGDPRNVRFSRVCSTTEDGGNSFEAKRVSENSWLFNHMVTTELNYATIGRYDRATSDSTGHHSGFFTSYTKEENGNLDVFGGRVE